MITGDAMVFGPLLYSSVALQKSIPVPLWIPGRVGSDVKCLVCPPALQSITASVL